MSFVTIYTYSDQQLAELARMRLESEGIPSLLPDGNTIRTTGLVNAMGGIRLQVPANVQSEAIEIIEKFNNEIGLEN